ncbi:MAG: hypothetical protein CSB23_00200 [Deltaproteobacteria bacterium]|nr:MAG: hypothetical protein CSB23_00200 [Deltaproteobacteria bacterium]
MTIILRNSSELAKATELINDLLLPIPESLQYDVFHNITPSSQHARPEEKGPLFIGEAPVEPSPQPVAPQKTVQEPVLLSQEELEDVGFTEERLEKLLANLCQQSSFQSAVVADSKGLPIGGINTPVAMEVLAAFSSVLGDVLDRVPNFFEQYEPGNISLDINYVDKVVVKKFLLEEEFFYLLILCSQDIDERAYIELFSEQITKVLKR